MPSGSSLADQIEKSRAGLGGEAAERDALELLLDALDVVGMAVAETADSDAGDEIEVLVPVDVGDRAALGVVDRDLRIERDRLEPRRHRLGLAIENRLGFGPGHGAAFSAVSFAPIACSGGRRHSSINSDVGVTTRGRRRKRSVRQSAIASAA